MSNAAFQICPKRNALPSPREISNKYHKDKNVPSSKFTHLVVQFGQFLDHDITETPRHEVKDCCLKGKNAECFPIPVPTNDNFYGPRNITCLEFQRSIVSCEENGGAKEQLNTLTHFVDASTVYGNEENIATGLRSFVDGKLKIGNNNLLPKDENGFEMAGDHRVTEMPGLASMHTLFVREHNRICSLIKSKHSYWTDEQIYQNARRILVGFIYILDSSFSSSFTPCSSKFSSSSFCN